jgi:hypothetical protein
MKKQLLMIALTLGFVATTQCKKTQSYQLSSGGSITVSSKRMPSVPAGVTATKVNGKKNRWVLTNTGTSTVTVRGKRK